ncbi:MAG: redoxin domain-containing protein [Bacteroidales bacterium]|jgi:peroxiredoxin|nr:redoxin domain-containing protein [Bacteroidales bacterium]
MKSSTFQFLIFVFSFCFLSAQAQSVDIELKTDSPGSVIRLIQFDDLLNWHGQTLFQDTADSRGLLRLKAEVDGISPAHLAINLDRVDLVLKPGSSYILEVNRELQQENLSYFDKNPPALLIKKAADDGLQEQLETVDGLINSFVMENFQPLFRLKKYSLLDSLQTQLDDLLGDKSLEYSRQYARYKYASIVLAVQRDGENKVINDFFKGQEVLYHNASYMTLFTEIFSDYLLGNRNLAMESLREMDRKTYPEWREYLRNDALLREDNRLSELIVLASLKYLYRDSRFKAKQVLAYLIYLKQNALYPEHQRMAANTIEAFQFLAPGTMAPDFALKDQNGKLFKLNDHKETMLLLQFVDESCRACLASLLELNEMQTELKDIQLVTLATGGSFEAYKKLFTTKNYDWPLLNLDKNILLLEAYHIKTFPEFIFLMPDAKIGMAPISQEKDVLFFHINRLQAN